MNHETWCRFNLSREYQKEDYGNTQLPRKLDVEQRVDNRNTDKD